MFASLASPRTPTVSSGAAWPVKNLVFAAMILVSVLYLGNVLTPIIAQLHASVVLTPLAWLIMALPSVCLAAGLYALLRRFAGQSRWVAAAIVAVPFALQSLIIAPLSHHRTLEPAQNDGGTLPIFAPNDILAIMDMPGRLTRGSGVCGPTCVHILQATSVEALFLPRTYIGELGEASGVIYQIAPRGKPCDVTVSLARRAQACLTTTPARLSQATHILAMEPVAPATASDTAVGRNGGLQIRLMGVGETGPIFRETGITGRSFSRWPLIGDPMLDGALPHIAPRFLTQPVERPLAEVSLIEWFAFHTIRKDRPLPTR